MASGIYGFILTLSWWGVFNSYQLSVISYQLSVSSLGLSPPPRAQKALVAGLNPPSYAGVTVHCSLFTVLIAIAPILSN
jgi:hypothetical protein